MSVPDSEGISLSPRCLSSVTCFNRWSVCIGWWSFCAPQEPGKLGSLFGLLRSWGILTLSSFFSWLCPTPDQAIFQSFTMPQCEARPLVQETVQHLDFLSFCRQRCENGFFYPLAAPSFGKAWSSPEESPCPPGLHANSSSGHQKGIFSVGPWCCSQGPSLVWGEVRTTRHLLHGIWVIWLILAESDWKSVFSCGEVQRPTVGRPSCPGLKSPGTDDFCFFLPCDLFAVLITP